MATTSPVGATSAAANTSTTTPALTSNTPPTTQLPSASSADFDRFLKLLTAQMQFQDPMNPTDATQFVAQLAQFSQVEQQTKTNTLLQGIAATLSGQANLAENAALLGKAVKTQSETVSVPEGGGSVPLTIDVASGTLRNLRLEVLDARGDVLRRVNLTAGTNQLNFDGKDGNGNALTPGRYTARVVGDDETGKRQTAGSLTMSGKVTELRRDSNGTLQLVLDNGAVIGAGEVTRLGG
ncbi:flagellar hook assembly protein FlgD [Pseudoroseomonas cervicalis]|uniref:flagellar hook assembly protein FlgD n=1 Tax=Teichococcus cervicalis TaxID=204525 RepID=UPI0027894712|nr:flagellar hook capping FlgD N-terminal domain-containing protein [Pseudoroseomonas cervicalis]MDQ1077497.1 flagellar basal-body rod modification protein FlgD [Pseudoroseomonas cervicalis]